MCFDLALLVIDFGILFSSERGDEFQAGKGTSISEGWIKVILIIDDVVVLFRGYVTKDGMRMSCLSSLLRSQGRRYGRCLRGRFRRIVNGKLLALSFFVPLSKQQGPVLHHLPLLLEVSL